IFSPVRRVSYEVEAARVGQRTDYDKLTLDVTTDGSLAPRDAIGQGAEILIRQLAIFTDLERIEGFGEQVGEEAGVEAPQAHGIETIGDLGTKTESELAAIPNFGKKSIEEVRETHQAHGLTLRDE